MTTADQARALVLSRIRAGLGVAGRDRTREATVEERLRAHPRGTIPARARADREALLELMSTMLAAQGAEVTRASTPEDAVRAVAGTYASMAPLAAAHGRRRAACGTPLGRCT